MTLCDHHLPGHSHFIGHPGGEVRARVYTSGEVSLPGDPQRLAGVLEMDAQTKYEKLLSSLPAQLEAAVGYTLSYHTGRDRAIGRDELVEQMPKLGVKANERQVREAIKSLRRKGHLIGAAAGEDGGYYFCASLAEVDDFLTREFDAKIEDMAVTRAATLRKRGRTMAKWLLDFEVDGLAQGQIDVLVSLMISTVEDAGGAIGGSARPLPETAFEDYSPRGDDDDRDEEELDDD